jgi:hypothetical protein
MVVLGGLGLVMGIVLERGPDGHDGAVGIKSSGMRLRWVGTREDEMNREV